MNRFANVTDFRFSIFDFGLRDSAGFVKSKIQNPKSKITLVLSRGERGQAAVERLLLSAICVAALVAMATYLRRAYMGYLRVTASGHGVQFDPTGTYTETQSLNRFSQVQDVQVVGGDVAVELFGGDANLPSTPRGVLAGRIRSTKVTATTDWDVSKDGNYEAR